jgi:hypothetical protein
VRKHGCRQAGGALRHIDPDQAHWPRRADNAVGTSTGNLTQVMGIRGGNGNIRTRMALSGDRDRRMDNAAGSLPDSN